MKKLFALLLALAMLLTASALADDLGVSLITPEKTTFIDPMNLDDIQLGTTYKIDGYAKITPVESMFVDFFAQFNKDANYLNAGGNTNSRMDSSGVFINADSGDWYYNWRWWDAAWKDSGLNAEFLWLKMDVTNLQKKPVDFTQDVTVTVIYDDDYKFEGWVRQINYDYMDYSSVNVSRMYADTKCPNAIVLDPGNAEEIDMLYTGTFAFGCTLPNSVVEDTKAPLRMEIKLGGNELTCNIRK